MPDQNGANSAGSVHGKSNGAARAIGNGTGEITFSLTLGGFHGPLAPKSEVQGLITWSFVANQKLELVDMYCDLI
jgi:hypothetical protein